LSTSRSWVKGKGAEKTEKEQSQLPHSCQKQQKWGTRLFGDERGAEFGIFLPYCL
jgi:hypothetical protein